MHRPAKRGARRGCAPGLDNRPFPMIGGPTPAPILDPTAEETLIDHAPPSSSTTPPERSIPRDHKSAGPGATGSNHEERRPGYDWSATVQATYYYLSRIMTSMFHILRWPATITMCILAMLFMYKHTMGIAIELAQSTAQGICQLPLMHKVMLCDIPERTVHPYFKKVIVQNQELVAFNDLFARNAALPFYLIREEWDLRGIILQLQTPDLPSQRKTHKLLQRYVDAKDESVHRTMACGVQTDALVGATITISDWAQRELTQIQERRTFGTIASVAFDRLLAFLLHLPPLHHNLRDVESTFSGYTQALALKGERVLEHYGAADKSLSRMIDVVGEILNTYKDDNVTLNLQKLQQPSYWKWVFKSHRETLRGFDMKMEKCAEYYSNVLAARKAIGIALLRLDQMGNGVKNLQSQLKSATEPLPFASGTSSLQLTIAALNASVEFLEHSRKAARELEESKVAEFRGSEPVETIEVPVRIRRKP